MINGVWIIKKRESVSIFHKIYGGKSIDADLFSGFLSGIYSFSEEITETGGIETMELADITLLYGEVSDLIFILAVTKDEDVEIIRKKIADISKVFLEKFGALLEDWDGNTTIFRPFERDLNQIIEKMRHIDFMEVPIKIPQKKRLKLSEQEFQLLSLCDGTTPTETIATKLNISELTVIKILKNLEKKKIIERKMVIKM